MGEAKQKREQLKAVLIKNIKLWDFPATEAEAQAVAEIKLLPVITVERYPTHILTEMGMPPNECHANARFMVSNDPEGKCRQITGFIPNSGVYVLHSVVERDGELFCVTPAQLAGPNSFRFIPDPDIEWVGEAGHMVAYRKGYVVEVGVRDDPVEQKRIAEIVLARVESGMDFIKAGEPPF